MPLRPEDIRTETKHPKLIIPAKPAQQAIPEGQLYRDEEGHWRYSSPQEDTLSPAETPAAPTPITGTDPTISNVVAVSAIRLAQAGIETSRLDAEVLMMHTLKVSKEELVKSWGNQLKPQELLQYETHLLRRINREPIAYIIGYKEFYGMNFLVDSRVMIPRPETELMVELILNYVRQWPDTSTALSIADIGTGAGTLALAIAKHLAYVKIYATDIAPESIEVAKMNAHLLKMEQSVTFLTGDLLTVLPHPVHIIVANLPYIPDAMFDTLQPEICRFEPKRCFVAGDDGLDLYRRMLEQTPEFLIKGGKILMEVLPQQVDILRTLVLSAVPTANIQVPHTLPGGEQFVIVHT